ncbi:MULTISPECIES: helix-turn-helix domain-containing protein [Micromonospora]|uniref:Homeodomain-like domain-containing protein n=1 Tax=Micromonospora humi TaxID=745366 RepID=A0A1C5HMQ3_9ACTN|nr:helix-turn-helix domain-containing protein [Micromonospora humi]SCG46851.1 Homeodomain-like domain-containing protein [Micromonospora humi]
MAGKTRLQRAAEELRALEMRRKGLRLEDIAKELGVDERTVSRRLAAAFHRMGSETFDQIRRRVEDQIDGVLREAHRLLANPDLSVNERTRVLGIVLQCERDRAALLGVRVPAHVVATVEFGNELEVSRGADRAGRQ